MSSVWKDTNIEVSEKLAKDIDGSEVKQYKWYGDRFGGRSKRRVVIVVWRRGRKEEEGRNGGGER